MLSKLHGLDRARGQNMYKKFKDSPYAKAAVTILVCGALLIVFSSWINNRQLSLGFETLNSTLAPVYIGIIFAFILCPVYNACVRFLYKKMLSGAEKEGFSIGGAILHEGSEAVTTNKLDRRTILTAARAMASVVCVILVVGLVAMLTYFVVPQLIQSIFNLANTMPDRLEVLSEWLAVHFARFPQLARWADNLAHAGTRDILRFAQDNILQGNAVSIANTITSGVAIAVKYVMNAVVGLLIMVYLLNYKERLFAICRKVVAATCGQKRQDRLYEFADIVNETFISFIVGRILDSIIIGVLTYVILSLFGIPFPVMISFIVGVTNVIPFFGPFIGALPSFLILMLESPIHALYFLIIVLVIQQLDGNVIGPKIVGNAIGISSFWVLIAVLVGGGLFGFMGMVFAVPVFAVVYRYVDKIMIMNLRQKDKPVTTADYFSLEQYDIEDGEIELKPVPAKKKSFLRRDRCSAEAKKEKKSD